MLLEAFGGYIFDRFGVKFGAFWGQIWVILEPLEAIFAPLGPPGAHLGHQGTPGPSQDPPRSVWERPLGAPGADFGPTWPQLEPTWNQLGRNLAPT